VQRERRKRIIIFVSGFYDCRNFSGRVAQNLASWQTSTTMWDHAEVAGLFDQKGYVRVLSRNEDEAPVANALDRNVVETLAAPSRPLFADAFARALRGEIVELLLCGIADAGYEFWGRVRLAPSPEKLLPVLFHMRRLPKSWGMLSVRERDVLDALNKCGMNAKRAAKLLGISVNTLNSHRRAICQKCQLHGVGEFWVYVQRSR
jgi:DNA-binding NarL/FixJ family response regulator